LLLTTSVGTNGANAPADVGLVKQRLIGLGFEWLAADAQLDAETVDAIRLVQAIVRGRQSIQGPGVDGRIDVGGETHRWLQAPNPPRWGKMPAGGSVTWGFRNVEVLEQTTDDHDWGTSWLAELTIQAGRAYRDAFLAGHPGRALIAVNDASKPRGGPTPDHAGHECGLCCDIRLPRLDGTAPGGTEHHQAAYDREAMRATLTAFRTEPRVSRIFFNDPILIGEGLCAPLAGHDDHAHIELAPPPLD